MDPTQPNSKAPKPLQRLHALAEKETIIAVLMALVAMLGMVTAYRTATAEEDVSLKESKLTQSRFLELTKREELLVRFSDSARFEVAKSAHLKRARDLQERAEKIRATDRGKASGWSCKLKRRFLSPASSSHILISQKCREWAIRVSPSTRLLTGRSLRNCRSPA